MKAKSDPGPADSSALFLRKQPILVSKPFLLSIQFWRMDRPLPRLAPASTFLFVARTMLENERLFSTAAKIIDEGKKRLTAQRAYNCCISQKDEGSVKRCEH